MTLPANSATITFANIATELGALGNTTVSASLQTISLNDPPIRYLGAGSGHTINSTPSSQISMGDLSTAYLREFFTVWGVGYLVLAEAVDSQGNIIVLFANTTTVTNGVQIAKYSPQLNYFYWMNTITFNNANSTSATNLYGNYAQVYIDDSDNIYVRLIYEYPSKYSYLLPGLIKFNSSGTYQWQTGALAQTTSVILGGQSGNRNATVYGSNNIIVTSGTFGSPSINIVNTASGVATSNNTWNVSTSSATSAYIYSVASAPTQSNAIICGYFSNTTNAYGCFSQISTTPSINWTRSITTPYTTIVDSAVDSSGNHYVLIVPYGGITAATFANLIIMKVNSSGTFQWSTSVTYSTAIDYPTLSSDINGNIYATAYSANASGNSSLFVSSFTNAGVANWHRLVSASTGTQLFYSVGNYSRPSVSGNRLCLPFYTYNGSTYTYGTAHINTSTGSGAGTYGNFKIAATTPTVTSSPTGYTSLNTQTGTLTGVATANAANCTVAANATPASWTFTYIT